MTGADPGRTPPATALWSAALAYGAAHERTRAEGARLRASGWHGDAAAGAAYTALLASYSAAHDALDAAYAAYAVPAGACHERGGTMSTEEAQRFVMVYLERYIARRDRVIALKQDSDGTYHEHMEVTRALVACYDAEEALIAAYRAVVGPGTPGATGG